MSSQKRGSTQSRKNRKRSRNSQCDQPVITPWRNAIEFVAVGRALCLGDSRDDTTDWSSSDVTIERALEIYKVWNARSAQRPHAVDSTAAFAAIRYREDNDSYVSSTELRLAYSCAVIRSVNGLADALQQQRSAAVSVSLLCQQLGIPDWLVELRHESTHNQLPPLPVLRIAANTLLDYFWNTYWKPIIDRIEQDRKRIFDELLTYKTLAVQISDLEASEELKVIADDREDKEESTHSESDSEDDSDELENDLWGTKIGSNINAFAALQDPPKKKNSVVEKQAKKEKKENKPKKKKRDVTLKNQAKKIIQMDVDLSILLETLLAFLVTGKGGLDMHSHGRGVLIPGAPTTFPETDEAARRIRDRYFPLISTACKNLSSFLSVLLVRLHELVFAVEHAAELDHETNAGSQRKLFFLDAWIRFLVSKSFLTRHVKKVTAKNVSYEYLLVEEDVPISFLYEHCCYSRSRDPLFYRTSRKLADLYESHFGCQRLVGSGRVINGSDADKEESTTANGTAIVGPGRPDPPMSLSLAEMEAMLNGQVNVKQDSAALVVSEKKKSIPQGQGDSNSQRNEARAAWLLCETWNPCEIGVLPGLQYHLINSKIFGRRLGIPGFQHTWVRDMSSISNPSRPTSTARWSIMIGSTIPPLSPYGTLTGQLFLYSGGRAAFESPVGGENVPNKCILLGGLSDGLLPTPYTSALEEVCSQNNWSLVQPILSSSYTGFGHGSLDRDIAEISELMNYMKAHRMAERFALVGHSTGCQDAVHFLRFGDRALVSALRLVVLQAPVSDREDAMEKAEYADNIKVAKDFVRDSKGEEMMPRRAFWAPISAQRFLDLQDVGGADDYFSSDFSDDALRSRLGHIGEIETLSVLVAFSGCDEYVPASVDTELLTERLVSAMNSRSGHDVAEGLYMPTANHNLSEGESDRFIAKVADLLKQAN